MTSVCFSPNGRFVLAFYLDSCVRTWDFVSMPSTVKKTYQGHANRAFSIGGCFGSLARDGAPRKEGGGDDDDDDDDDTLAFVTSASEDGDIVMWDVKSKEVVQRIEGAHDGVCFWVDVHGESMVSCGQDGRIVLYRHNRGATLAEVDAMGGIDIKEEDGASEVVDDKPESASPDKMDVVMDEDQAQ